VQPGETLYGIAWIYQLKEKDLSEATNGISPETLRPGQRLRIPDETTPEEEHAYIEEGLVYHTVKR